MGTGTFCRKQVIWIHLWAVLLCFAASPALAQVYLTEGFETPFTGTPGAPTGWSQTRTVLIGDGIPDPVATDGEHDWEQNTWTGSAWTKIGGGGTRPTGAFAGTGVLYMNEYNFGGTTTSAFGNRQINTPPVNLASSSSPYVRFRMFYNATSNRLHMRILSSVDNGVTWQTLQWVVPNFDETTVTGTTTWDQINILIPPALRVANVRFAIDYTNTFGLNDVFIDEFSIEEFTPTTITAVASGNWNSPATWGGTIPTSDNHVVIPTGITVSANVNIVRVQDVTIDGTLQYSGTSTTQLLHIQGNLVVSPGGTFFSGNGTTGKRTYLSGNLTNDGTLNFSPGTSATGALFWIGGGTPQNFTNNGILTAGRIPIVYHANDAGIIYNSPITISNICGLVQGVVTHNGNLTFGNAPATGTVHLVHRLRGALASSAIYNNANVARFNAQYACYYTSIIDGPFTVFSPTTIQTGPELAPTMGGLIMNTFDNVQLTNSLLLDATTITLTFTRGILLTTSANLLTIGSASTGSTGSAPSTSGTLTNPGSYVVGPVKIIFPTTGTAARNFPLGVGAQLQRSDNQPLANLQRHLVISSTGAWTGTEVTAEIVDRPSGSVNSPLTSVIGTRAYRITQTGTPLPATATVQLRAGTPAAPVPVTFGDSLVGDVPGLRIAQAPSLTGPWTERSTASGTGPLVLGSTYIRNTATIPPGPINADEFFAFATVSPLGDLALTSILFPNQGNSSCFGTDSAVVRITNQGAGTTNFATDTFVVTVQTTGAFAQTISRVVNTGTLAPGQSIDYNVGNLNLSALGTYDIRAWVKQANDPVVANDSSTVLTLINNEINTFPSVQNFESFISGNGTTTVGTLLGGWGNVVNGLGDDFDWFVFNGATPTTGTGPNVDRTLGTTAGKYMYARGAATGALPNRTATLVSPCIDLTTNAAPRLSFFYHMAGTAVGSLNVDVFSGGIWTNVFSLSGSQQATEAEDWREAQINLSAYAGQRIKLRFRATTLTSISTDIAIDDVRIVEVPATDLTITELVTPGTLGCRSATQTISLRVRNDGTASQSNIPLKASITGPVTTTLTGTLAGPLAPGATALATLSGNFNMQAPGTYAFTLSVDQPGDADRTNDTLRATRVSDLRFAIPYNENFNAIVTNQVPAGWLTEANGTLDDYRVRDHGSPAIEHGVGGSRALVTNLWSGNPTSIVAAPIISNLPSNAIFSFAYRIVDWLGNGATTLGTGDTTFLLFSTDCGITFSQLPIITSANHVPSTTHVTRAFCLGSFAGQDIQLGLFSKRSTGDYIIAIDDWSVRVPAAPTAAGATLCGPGNVTLSASTAEVGVLSWYATRTSTTALGTGTTYTASFTGNDSVFVASDVAGCIGERRRVDVTVNPLPSDPVVPSPAPICAGNTATFTPDPVSGVTFLYFNAATGGTQLGSGASFTTGTLNADFTVHVAAVQGTCTSATRTASTVTVTALPNAPIVPNPPAICTGNIATFTPFPATGVNFLYFDAATGGTQLGSGPSYTTGTLTANTTVFVAAVENGCTSATRSASSVTVNALPAAPTVPTPPAVCDGSTATFTPDPVTGVSFLYFDDATGGTQLGSGASYTTGALLANFTVHVAAVQNGCTSATRTPSTVTVNPLPDNGGGPASTFNCGVGNTVNLSVPTPTTGVTYNWYDAPTGGTLLATGNQYNFVFNGSVTLYIEGLQNGCTSATRSAYQVDLRPVPPAPIGTGDTVCAGQNVTVQAAGSATGTITWWDAASGGTLLGTGSLLTLTAPTGSQTVYAQDELNGCISARIAVQASIQQIPAAPIAPDTVVVCTNSAASLAATAPGTITWWDASSGGNLLFTGIQYTTPALATSQSFFVQTEVNGCVSPRAEVFVEVGNALGAPQARDTAICAGRTATLAALGSGTLSWYDAPTGGTALGTGFFFTTPALSTTTTYYVEAVQGTCVSTRTPVVVTVNAAPVTFTVAGATTAVEATQETYTLNNPETGVTYSWTVTGGTPASATGTSLTVTWGTPGAGTITIVGENANGCETSTVVNVTINSATSVAPGLQTTFSMSQNYPNPSADQTSIDVLLPIGQYGVISVFDLNAKLVERISTDISKGSPMTVQLNTSRLTAGVYTYTLDALAGSISRRLTVIK